MRRSLHAVVLAIAALVAPGLAHGQTVDDIVAKNLKAKGGLEKLQATNSVKMTCSITLQGNTSSMQVWSKRPNLFRREVEAPAPQGGQAQTIVQASDGKTVWMVNPMMTGSQAPQVVPAAQARMMQADADFDGVFVNYKDRGTSIELVGTEKLDDKEVYHLRVTPKGADPQQYYLDVASGLEVKVTRSVEQGGSKMTIETELSDYRSVDGMTVPFATRQLVNGTPLAQVTIKQIEFNVPVDDSMFKMPTGPGK